MSFYRPATKGDFMKAEKKFDAPSFYDEVKEKVEEGKIHQAVILLQSFTGKGGRECFESCIEYQEYLLAKKDFEEGKPVFVSY